MRALFFSLLMLGAMPVLAASFYDLTAKSIDGKDVKLSEYKGRLTLVVNVASKCGYTKQYKGLEEIYEKYKGHGFAVLGFPSNDFMGQEPGTAEEIKTFCKMNYGVTFPLFEKNPVKGDKKQSVYKFLVENSPIDKGSEVGWNFEKFLVGPDGKILARWKSGVTPESTEVNEAIAKNLPGTVQK